MNEEQESQPSKSTPPAEFEFEGSEIKRTTKWLISMIVLSFIFAFASIPLYRIVCRQTDPGGSSAQNGESEIYDGKVDKTREVRVRFTTSVNRQLLWEFDAMEPYVTVHPGEKRQTMFSVKNLDNGGPMRGKGVYDIVPAEAGKYFKKIECFCFREQTLSASQQMDLPLVFWLDEELPDHIKEVTIAYTFFNMDTSLQRSIKAREERASR